jgi:hypothetical protein
VHFFRVFWAKIQPQSPVPMPAPQTREAPDQDEAIPQDIEKGTRTQRRKRRLEESSSIAAQSALSNGVETAAKDKEAVRIGEIGTVMRRKRKRGAEHRGNGRTSALGGREVNGISSPNIVSKASGPMPLWKISEAIGGRLIHADPVFSTDEK